MYGIRHDIGGDFPEFQAQIFRLKNRDPLFTQLLSEYDNTDKVIYGLEQQAQPVSDTYFNDLKRHRLLLKDKLYIMLRRQS